MKKILDSDWVWKVYGFMFSPIELLLIFLLKGEDDTIGLFKLIGIMLILSILYHLVPLIIRLILKAIKIDFFDIDDQIETYTPAEIGLALTWIPLILYATKSEGIAMRIITLIFVLPFIFAQVGVFAYFDGIANGDKKLFKKVKETNSNPKSKVGLTMTEIIGEDGSTKTAYTLKNGSVAHTTITNEFGNPEGEFTTIKHDLNK